MVSSDKLKGQTFGGVAVFVQKIQGFDRRKKVPHIVAIRLPCQSVLVWQKETRVPVNDWVTSNEY